MICELKDRLGDRTDILFVTKQDKGRTEIERAWFQTLGVEYLDWGFEGFMAFISQHLTSQIGPSKIVPQLASCRVIKFGEIYYKIRRPAPGSWECWIDYTINDPEGFVGIIFQTKNEPLDISQYDRVRFEMNIPETPRQKQTFEALKLEGYNRIHSHPIDLTKLKANEWGDITLNIDKFKRAGARSTLVRQVVFTDTGRLTLNTQKYRVGIRNVVFEKVPTSPSAKILSVVSLS